MSDLDHLWWFIATAVMTVTVLTLGTLAAAGILTRRPGEHAGTARTPDPADESVRPTKGRWTS